MNKKNNINGQLLYLNKSQLQLYGKCIQTVQSSL